MRTLIYIFLIGFAHVSIAHAVEHELWIKDWRKAMKPEVALRPSMDHGWFYLYKVERRKMFGKRGVLKVNAGQFAQQYFKLSRGKVPFLPQRYMVFFSARHMGKGTTTVQVGAGLYGKTISRQYQVGKEWSEVMSFGDTAPSFPGANTSNFMVFITNKSKEAKDIEVKDCRIMAIPPYRICMRYKVLHPKVGYTTGTLKILKHHFEKNHRDPDRRVFGFTIDKIGGAKGLPAGEWSEALDLFRNLKGDSEATGTFEIEMLKGGAKAQEILVEIGTHIKPPPPKKENEEGLVNEEGEGMELDDAEEAPPDDDALQGVFYRGRLKSTNGRFTFILPENEQKPETFFKTFRTLDHEIAERLAASQKFKLPRKIQDHIGIGANISHLSKILSKEQIEKEIEILLNIGIRSMTSDVYEVFKRGFVKRYGHEPRKKRIYGRLEPIPYASLYSPYDKGVTDNWIEKRYELIANHYGKIKPFAVELMDEPFDPALLKKEIEAFRDYMKKGGYTPKRLGAESWDTVYPVGFDPNKDKLPEIPVFDEDDPLRQIGANDVTVSLEDTPPPPQDPDVVNEDPKSWSLEKRHLHYHTRLFTCMKTAELFKIATSKVKKHYPDALTSVNFRAGVRSVLKWETSDWFLFGREKAVTYMWNEDWINSYGKRQNGVQLVSYYVELMYTAARKHGLPVGNFLIMNGHNELKSYSSLAHGSRFLHYWRYGPNYANYLPYSWSHGKESVESVANIVRDVAKIEGMLVEAKRFPAKVAVLYPKTDPIWGYRQDEHRLLYMALLHAQIPVELVTEAEVIEDGLLDKYEYLYVGDHSVKREVIAKIKPWLHAGGKIFLSGGALTRDIYHEPLREIDAILGIERGDGSAVSKKLGFELSCSSHGTLKSKTGKVTMKFQDGSAAVIEGKVGKGSYRVFAFRPGLLYEKSVTRQRGKIQFGWSDERRKWITDYVKRSNHIARFSVDIPGIEVMHYEHPNKDILFLMNYTGKKLDKGVNVYLKSAKRLRKTWAIRCKVKEGADLSGTYHIKVPLDLVDTLIFEHR